MLNLIEAQLASFQPKLVTAENAQEAFKILKSGLRPDVILCDIMMPGEDGYRFHQKIRNGAAWLRTPFIYVTALDQYDAYRRGMNLGADGYLSKPFSQKELVQEIQHVLSRHEEYHEQEKVYITMLGGQFVRYGEVLNKAPDRGAEQVVFYMILQGTDAVKRRNDLMDELWDEITLSGFRSVLSRAKRWSENWADWYITNQSVSIKLKDNVVCDLYELEHILDETDDIKAIESLYKGPLLPAYQESWVTPRREILANRVKQSYLRAVNENDTPRELIHSLKRVITVDPDDFETWEKLIKAYESAGMTNEAKMARQQLEQQQSH